MHLASSRPLLSVLLSFAGAAVAVFVTGKLETAALAAFSVGAGLGLVIGRPVIWPGWTPLILAVLYLGSAATSFLFAGGETLPQWRGFAPEAVQLSASFAAMPVHAFFWWLVLAGTIAVALFLASSPLDIPSLRVFLHAAVATVAVYAVTSIVQSQTAWSFPFSGSANFGLLPNRNHTATLLVVGSVVSFGLMQWEVMHRHPLGAVLAALWGAPSLAALLFFSTSRAGVLFLLAGFVLWAAGAAGQALSRRSTLWAAVILAVFLGILFIFGGSTVRDRLAALWQDVASMEAGEEGVAREVDFRQPVFRDTLAMIADAPMTGHGLGHFEFVFPHYRDASVRAVRVLHPESDWLMVAAESGIPAAVILMTLAGWFFFRCWRARKASGGLLRWTVASAIGAALLHGLIDVPWHRPALGWFLLVFAVAALPSTGVMFARPKIWQSLQFAAGLALLGGGAYAGWQGLKGRPPLVYRWGFYDQRLESLGSAREHEQGEALARKALQDFPLNYQAYYWRASFLRTFEGTDEEIVQDIGAGRFVEPVLPAVAAEQAQIWAGIDDRREAECRAEAVRRAALIEARSGVKGAAAAELDKGLRAAQDRPAVQVALREQLQDQPPMLANWVCLANSALVEDYLSGLGAGAGAWLDGLPEDERARVLERWITMPSAAEAVAYLEARGGATVYGRQLASFYAKQGDRERAVRMMAGAEGVSLASRETDGEFGGQLAGLEAQGNGVAVRRLLKEAVDAKEADRERLAVAVSWYAAAGDWEMAWRAASRLASTRKNGQ